MRLVKRAAITVTPKQPYIDWANGIDEDGVKIGEDFEPEKSVYLIGDVSNVIPFDRDVIVRPLCWPKCTSVRKTSDSRYTCRELWIIPNHPVWRGNYIAGRFS